MTTNDPINSWAARYRNANPITRWHYIESVIAERLVTHCGRQMAKFTAKGEMVVDPSPAPTAKCERCAR